MIIQIVDPSGKQIYRGYEQNVKVAKLVAAGNTMLRSLPPDAYSRWDGIIWVPGPVPVPPTDADHAEQRMTSDPFIRAWVKRQARKEGKTPRQVMDEIRADA